MRTDADARASYSPLFILVTCLFIAALISANIISVKLIAVGNWFVPAGVVIFPLSYIFGDVLTEVYGYRSARRVIWLGFLCNLLVVLAIWVAGLWPAAPFWQDQQAYNTILGFTPRLLLASFLAYLVGEFAQFGRAGPYENRHLRSLALEPYNRVDHRGRGIELAYIHQRGVCRRCLTFRPGQRR